MFALNSMHREFIISLLLLLLLLLSLSLLLLLLLLLLYYITVFVDNNAFVLSKRRPKSQYGGRTVFNLITLSYLKYKETTLALGLTSVTVITWKSTENLPLDCLRTCGK